MPVRLKYGINEDGKLHHVNEVERGIACNCICPECRERLIARKGEINQPHFAHSSGKECRTAPETAIHLLAKEIIAENTEIYLAKESSFEYSKCELEKQIAPFRIDAFITNEHSSICVEIIVTNEISNEKEKVLIESGNQLLVIDLKNIDRGIGKEELEIEVLANIDIRRLLSNKEPELVNESSGSKNSNYDGYVIFAIALIIFIFYGRSSSSKYRTKKRYSRMKKRKFGT